MSKKIGFLIFFVVLLGLGSTVQAALLPVVNGSFEKDNDGNWITSNVGIWDVCDVGGWLINDTTGWASGWNFAGTVYGNPPIEGFDVPDGNAAYFSITWGDVNVPSDTSEIYQILDANVDANVTIAANKRYTLTFNALNMHDTNNPVVYGALYRMNGAAETRLAYVSKVLTQPRFGLPDYAGWEEVQTEYIVLTGNPNIGSKLRVKLTVPYPWFSGCYVGIDDVRVTWDWLSNAYSPIPANGADQVSRTTTLKWKPGLWAKTPAKKGGHEVYFGVSESAVEAATTATAGIFRGAVDNNNYDPCTGDLVLGKTYYWRIDEVNAGYVPNPAPPYPPGGKWKGDVWSFTVEGRARNPYPGDGAKDVPRNVILQWIAGTAAKYHDVYFGTSASAVEAATTATSGIYKTRLNKGTEEYDTSSLSLQVAKRYFWRIDEVNTMTVKGYVWDFRVIDFMLIDDFEFYASTTAMRVKWKDATTGLPGNANVWLNTDASFANGDGNSMRFEYYNNGSKANSETKRTYSTNQNWSYAGNSVTRMELSYYGDLDNGPDPPMYVKLGDGTKTAQVNCPALGEVNTPWAEQWQHVWNIPLKDFKGVNLAKVSSIILGVGDLSTTGEGGGKAEDGTLYFDDIKLWPPVCNTAMIGEANLHAVGDFTTAHHDGEDCITDYEDLRLMAERDWLMKDTWMPTDPPDTNGLIWYRFNEGSGTTVTNSGTLGTAFNGSFSTVSTEQPDWVTDSYQGGWALHFDPTYSKSEEGDHIHFPSDLGLPADTNHFSMTCWTKLDVYPGQWTFPVLIESRAANNNAEGLGLCEWGELCYWWNNIYWDWHTNIWPTTNTWAFTAVTVEPCEATVYYSLYGSGTVAKATNTAYHGDTNGFNTGFTNSISDNSVNNGGGFDGRIDDVRIFDYTLTEDNIMHYAEANDVPLADWRADIDNDGVVDLTDYSILANNWLDRLLWPMP